MPDPAAPDGSMPQQLWNWQEKQELQVGHCWTSSIRQMASLHAGPQPVISRGSFLPVFHIQFQPSAFNFSKNWRNFFSFFFCNCKQKIDPNYKRLPKRSSPEQTAFSSLCEVEIQHHLYLSLLKAAFIQLLKRHLNL